MEHRKADAQIVDEVNEVARMILEQGIGTGYTVPAGYRFWKAEDYRSQRAWQLAVDIYELITKTEVHDAVLAVEEDAR
jgi:hypothetical protein